MATASLGLPRDTFSPDLFGVVVLMVSLPSRGLKDLEQDSSSMEKRFAYKFLKKLLKYVDSAQEFIAHLGTLASQMSR